jgi:hypothetical protein
MVEMDKKMKHVSGVRVTEAIVSVVKFGETQISDKLRAREKNAFAFPEKTEVIDIGENILSREDSG